MIKACSQNSRTEHPAIFGSRPEVSKKGLAEIDALCNTDSDFTVC